MRAFVTVGATTHFDPLVETILGEDVIAALEKKGYNKLVIQVGPSLRYGETSEQRGGVSIEMWKLKTSLQSDFESSDLVISHAGMVYSFP